MNSKNYFFRNPCSIYFALWSIYLLQGTFYETGGILSQASLLAIIVISLMHAIKVADLNIKKPMFIKGLNLLIIMYTIYGLFLFVTDGFTVRGKTMEVPSMIYLKGYYMSLLPIYTCYYYTIKGNLNERLLKKWVPVFLIVAIAQYFRMQRDTLALLEQMGSTREEITNNAGYILLSLIPSMVIYRKKEIVQFIGIGICIAFVILGMKRGAILVAAISLVMITWYSMISAKKGRKIVIIAFVIAAYFSLENFVRNLLINSDYFVARIEQTLEGDSSGRDTLYMFFWDTFCNHSSTLQQLFGYGANGTIKISENYAHNDWLEILTNQGILGVLVFSLFFFYFIQTIRNKKLYSASRFTLLLIFVSFFLQTLFSGAITNLSIYATSIWGYALADGFSKTYPKKIGYA